MAYTRQQLLACQDASIPDLIGDRCRLLFVGINPGLQTAMTGIHFAHPSNRFWPALRRAGIIDSVPDVSPVAPSVRLDGRVPSPDRVSPPAGGFPMARPDMVDPDRLGVGAGDQFGDVLAAGIGMTNLVRRATSRASELSRAELEEGARRLTRVVAEVSPAVVAVAGVTAYRQAFGNSRAVLGPQPEAISGCAVWVVPNPSGLNAHETIDSLADWYLRVASAAGIA